MGDFLGGFSSKTEPWTYRTFSLSPKTEPWTYWTYKNQTESRTEPGLIQHYLDSSYDVTGLNPFSLFLQCEYHRLRGHFELLHWSSASTNGLPFGKCGCPRILFDHSNPQAVQIDEAFLWLENSHSNIQVREWRW